MVTQEEINELFMEAVRYLKAQGYSQKDIVLKAKLGQNVISKIKKGENNAGDETIRKLAESFRLNIDFFYGRSPHVTMQDKARENFDNALHESQELLARVPASASIDSSSAFNAAISAYVQLVEARDKVIEEKEARIKDLERTIADKETIIRDREARIAALERQLAVEKSGDLSSYPFAFGEVEHDDHARQKR